MQTHIVAKTVVFNAEGQLLVLRRSADDTHRPGGFDFPGGKVEEGENIFEGAIREAAEETGLQLDKRTMQLVFATCKVGYHEEERTDINIVWLGFVTKLVRTQTVHLSHEHQAFSWQTIAHALKDCDGPTQKMFLEHLRDHNLAKELLSH